MRKFNKRRQVDASGLIILFTLSIIQSLEILSKRGGIQSNSRLGVPSFSWTPIFYYRHLNKAWKYIHRHHFAQMSQYSRSIIVLQRFNQGICSTEDV